MKIWAFIKWHYSKLQFWQKLWILAFVNFGWFIAGGGQSEIALAIGVSLIIVVITKWLITDPIINSWKKFKQERQDLFDLIETSDKK